MWFAIVLVLSMATGMPIVLLESEQGFPDEAACYARLEQVLPAIKANLDPQFPGGVAFQVKCEQKAKPEQDATPA